MPKRTKKHNRRFKFTGESKSFRGVTLNQIVATRDFTTADNILITAGTVGGWVEKYENLTGYSWCAKDAMIFGGAQLRDRAFATDSSRIYGTAVVRDDVLVGGSAVICGEVVLSGNSVISGRTSLAEGARLRDVLSTGDARVSADAVLDGVALQGNTVITSPVHISVEQLQVGGYVPLNRARISSDKDVATIKYEGDFSVRGLLYRTGTVATPVMVSLEVSVPAGQSWQIESPAEELVGRLDTLGVPEALKERVVACGEAITANACERARQWGLVGRTRV